MEIFFADDSTQKGVRDGMGALVALGGVLFPESAIRPFAEAMNEITSRFSVPEGEEVKWSPKKGSWIYENLKGDDRSNCYAEILRAAAGFDVRALVIVWDTGRTTLKGERAFEKCLDYAFERLAVNLSKRTEKAIIVADRPGGGKKQEDGLLANFLDRVQSGTTYSVPDWCLLNILTTPSKLLRQLQLADLVTGITTAMVAGSHKYAAPLFEEVRPMLMQNHFGSVAGTGLKLFPDALVNVYHWVLKEDFYWKVGSGTGFDMPVPEYPYDNHEFTA